MPSLDDKLKDAAKVLAGRGLPPAEIAKLLGVDEAAVTAALAVAGEASGGKVLGSNLQEKLDDLLNEDPDLCCPVSLMLFTNPVVASDGFMYNKDSLDNLLKARMVSPMTREPLKKEYFPAHERKRTAYEFRQTQSEVLLKFAEEVVGQEPQIAKAAVERAEEYIGVLTAAKVPELAAKYRALCGRLGMTAQA